MVKSIAVKGKIAIKGLHNFMRFPQAQKNSRRIARREHLFDQIFDYLACDDHTGHSPL